MDRRLLSFVSLLLILAFVPTFAPSQVGPHAAQAQRSFPVVPVANQQAPVALEPAAALASSSTRGAFDTNHNGGDSPESIDTFAVKLWMEDTPEPFRLYLPIVMKPEAPARLVWPIGCVPGRTCSGGIGYPDIDDDGLAFNCGQPGYRGHQGTDIGISWEQMDQGMPVYAAADGQVLWVFDGKYDRCPSPHPDCQGSGTIVCTESGPYCGTGTCCCSWCFAGGNVVVIRHFGLDGVFATRYDHLRTYSILVTPGQIVSKGQKIAEVGSAGNSTGPHLHFEVWGTGFYELADPWAGPCGPNFSNPLWAYDPPWEAK